MKKILLLLLVILSQSCQQSKGQADASVNYTYMQIFYVGPKSLPGSAFINLTPEFHKQKDIRLDEKAENFADLDFKAMIKLQEERSQKMRDVLIKTLNSVAAEGWEVVQMSSYGDGGLVYLFRRAK